jgi:hypothetical protein
MISFIAALAVAGFGALAVPEPTPIDVEAAAVDAMVAEAQGDFEAAVFDLGPSGAAPLHGLEPVGKSEEKASGARSKGHRARRSATSKSTSRP